MRVPAAQRVPARCQAQRRRWPGANGRSACGRSSRRWHWSLNQTRPVLRRAGLAAGWERPAQVPVSGPQPHHLRGERGADGLHLWPSQDRHGHGSHLRQDPRRGKHRKGLVDRQMEATTPGTTRPRTCAGVEFEVNRAGPGRVRHQDTPEQGLEKASGLWASLCGLVVLPDTLRGCDDRAAGPSPPKWQSVQPSLSARRRPSARSGSSPVRAPWDSQRITPPLIGYLARRSATLARNPTTASTRHLRQRLRLIARRRRVPNVVSSLPTRIAELIEADRVPVTAGTIGGSPLSSSPWAFGSPPIQEGQPMLTVAYLRVSTNEQAEEGFSIEGQTEKMKAYALLHDLGEVTVDRRSRGSRARTPMSRPGLQQAARDGRRRPRLGRARSGDSTGCPATSAT